MKWASYRSQKLASQAWQRSGPLAWKSRKNGRRKRSIAGECIRMSLSIYSELGAITIVTVGWILAKGM
jgi:hypothetical protein